MDKILAVAVAVAVLAMWTMSVMWLHQWPQWVAAVGMLAVGCGAWAVLRRL